MDASVLKDFWLPLLILLMSTTISPVVVAMAASRSLRLKAREDYARQDAVAAQAAQAATLLLEQQEKAALRIDEVARQTREAARLLSEQQGKTSARAEEVASKLDKNTTVTNDKLDVIHTLVNSSLTASMQTELGATQRTLVLMLEMIEMKKSGGLTVSADAMAEVEAAKIKISELKTKLSDRARQQEIADKQLKIGDGNA